MEKYYFSRNFISSLKKLNFFGENPAGGAPIFGLICPLVLILFLTPSYVKINAPSLMMQKPQTSRVRKSFLEKPPVPSKSPPYKYALSQWKTIINNKLCRRETAVVKIVYSKNSQEHHHHIFFLGK